MVIQFSNRCRLWELISSNPVPSFKRSLVKLLYGHPADVPKQPGGPGDAPAWSWPRLCQCLLGPSIGHREHFIWKDIDTPRGRAHSAFIEIQELRSGEQDAVTHSTDRGAALGDPKTGEQVSETMKIPERTQFRPGCC